MSTKTKTKSKKKTAVKVIAIIVAVIAALAIFLNVAGTHKSKPEQIKSFDTTNPYILTETDISGHRSGGGIAPEETLMAFKNCAENPAFSIDVFEFDLHITGDDVLVLLHDDTLDRTSDCEEVFGEKDVRPETKTFEELKTLNMGAKFENEQGETPYADLKGDEVPDELRILSLDEVLDYLTSAGDYKYIIEIKNGEDLGRKGVDILYKMLTERNLLDQVIFGTFKGEISEYVDENYPDLTRSTGITEALEFWWAALTNSKSYEPPCKVLQLPYGAPFSYLGINMGTAQMINYAHEHDMAIQYWTVNEEEDMEYLISVGADCIMTDYPDVLYNVKNK